MARHAPLSALDAVPLTEETRAQLVAAGVPESTLIRLSEMGGQGLLLLHKRETGERASTYPSCYSTDYNPVSPLCQGCVFGAKCWHADQRYLGRLKQGKAQPPAGVPLAVVERTVEGFTAPESKPPPPPRKRKAPPPPARKRKAPPSRRTRK